MRRLFASGPLSPSLSRFACICCVCDSSDGVIGGVGLGTPPCAAATLGRLLNDGVGLLAVGAVLNDEVMLDAELDRVGVGGRADSGESDGMNAGEVLGGTRIGAEAVLMATGWCGRECRE